MTKLQCPNVVAAATKLAEHQQAAEGKDLWALADALVKDCDDDANTSTLVFGRGHSNGAKAKLEVAQRELKAAGIDYELMSLQHIRAVAITFRRADRIDGLGFWSHHEAGNPEILIWIMKTTPKRERKDRFGIISVNVIREKAKQYRQIAKNAKEREHTKAVAKMKAATTLDEKRAAKEQVDQLETMPKSGSGSYKPSDSELRNNANIMGIDNDLQAIAPALKEILSRMRALRTIDEAYAAGFVKDCERIKAAVTHIENFLEGKSNVHSIGENKIA